MEPVRGLGRRLRSLGRPRILPSLYDLHPHAATATRRPLGMRVVPIDRIVGTARHPSQNTDDFLPLPQLRGGNWRGRWQRLNRAMQQLVTLPPVDLLRVGRDYWVVDGHNRVAAARQNGVVGIDADVVELLLPGVEASTRPPHSVAGSMSGADELRQAASGRHTRTVVHRPEADEVSRADLLRGDDSLNVSDDTGAFALPPSEAVEEE
ncbi:MAG TPA: hypothetical protein VFM19_01090 [Candidatus Limnocylindria bacterium]|nr:hypothetical protein [Candidatus Limnocylindria bacterium]